MLSVFGASAHAQAALWYVGGSSRSKNVARTVINSYIAPTTYELSMKTMPLCFSARDLKRRPCVPSSSPPMVAAEGGEAKPALAACLCGVPGGRAVCPWPAQAKYGPRTVVGRGRCASPSLKLESGG